MVIQRWVNFGSLDSWDTQFIVKCLDALIYAGYSNWWIKNYGEHLLSGYPVSDPMKGALHGLFKSECSR